MFKKLLTISKSRNLLSVFISALVFSLIFVISASNLLYVFDKKIQDMYFIFNDIKINKDIIILEIDEDTLAGRKDNSGNIVTEGLGRFPFDRKYYGTVIDNLNKADVAVIGMDIIFGEKSNEVSDNILSDSIKRAGNIVLGLWPNSSGILQLPYDKFGDYILTSGYFTPNVDKRTNVVYSITPFSKFRGSEELYNHFAISVIKGFYSEIYDDKRYLVNNTKILSDKFIISNKLELLKSREYSNEVLINYANRDRFTKFSFLDIYNNNFDKELFKDKIVVIGATAKGIKDVFSTPIGTEYGVYTHVNMINTILTKNGIKYFDSKFEWFLIFLLIIVSVYFNISKSSYVLIFSNVAIVALFILGVLYITVLTNLLLNFPIELALALIFSLAISNIAKYLIENKNKTKLNKALSEYVSKDVADEILSGEGKVNLDGENKKISIFFSDIEGFTSISEKFSPEELVSFLREYLSDMSDIILDEKGFINKYEGDAIMALWGVFGSEGSDTNKICLTALKQQKRLAELNVEWTKRGFLEIKARIGIHMGNAIIGNIGSQGRKMEFTALGDSVNLASRLEGVNKFYGTYICVSEDVYKIEKSNFEFRFLDKIRVKGKENSIKIYELLGYKGDISKEERKLRTLFNKGVKLYLSRDFKSALVIFEELIVLGDNASKLYLNMCNLYIKNPPSDDWDGVSTMDSK